MPSHLNHTHTALRALRRLPTLAPQAPAYLLGSIAADARYLDGSARSVTHFWPPRTESSGAWQLLADYPHLAARSLEPAAQAFVAGYLCHLLADERWIAQITRPFFGTASEFVTKADRLDAQRVLYDLIEERYRARGGWIEETICACEAAGEVALPEALVPVVSMRVCQQWREIVLRSARLTPGPDRIRLFQAGLARLAAPAADAARGAGTLPSGLPMRDRVVEQYDAIRERVGALVEEATADAYEDAAVEASISTIRAYLAGRTPSARPAPLEVAQRMPAVR